MLLGDKGYTQAFAMLEIELLYWVETLGCGAACSHLLNACLFTTDRKTMEEMQ